VVARRPAPDLLRDRLDPGDAAADDRRAGPTRADRRRRRDRGYGDRVWHPLRGPRPAGPVRDPLPSGARRRPDRDRPPGTV